MLGVNPLIVTEPSVPLQIVGFALEIVNVKLVLLFSVVVSSLLTILPLRSSSVMYA